MSSEKKRSNLAFLICMIVFAGLAVFFLFFGSDLNVVTSNFARVEPNNEPVRVCVYPWIILGCLITVAILLSSRKGKK